MGAMPDSIFLIAIFAFYSLVVAGGIAAFFIYDKKQKKKANSAAQTVANLDKQYRASQTELMFLQQTQRSQNLYGAAVHGLSDGVVIVDKNGAIQIINPAVESILSIPSLDMKDQHYRSVFHFMSDKGDEIAAPFEKALLGTATGISKWTFLKTEKGPVPIDGSVIPLKTAGEIIGALFVFRNATVDFDREKEVKDREDTLTRERDNTRKELATVKTLTDLARNVISTVTHGLIILDATGHVAYVNPYVEHFTNKYLNDIQNKHYREVFAFTDKDGNPKDAPVEDAMKGATKQFEKWTFLNTHATGRTPIKGSATPLRRDTIVSGVVIELSDASIDFQEVEDDKAFFSAAAHDLRSPLSAIRSMVELLVGTLETAPKEKSKELLANTNDAVLQLIALVNDLLNISRIEQGRLVIAKDTFDIVEMTREIVTTQVVIANGKKLYLTHEAPAEKLPDVIADKNKTRDVLTNLMGNAIKYTPQGGVTITHTLEDSTLVNRITDTGAGISPEDARLLWRKFQQVGTARGQTVAKSTGLGLYIAKKFANLMGGDVALEKSEPGKGSTFTFTLPVAVSVQADNLQDL